MKDSADEFLPACYYVIEKEKTSDMVDNNYSIENFIIHATNLFKEHFNSDPDICGCGPGRVNLIGEHTDYNEGFVLPMALPMITIMIGKKTSSNHCRIVTACPVIKGSKEIKFEVKSGNKNIVLHPGKPEWANYVKGVIMNFKGKLCAFDALITTSVPVGGGLSSSAALEVATYTFLEGLDDGTSKIGMIEKILACQKAEHDFAGTPCGIMDQFISFMGKKDHALLLDCRSLKFELISLKSLEVAVLITNTNVHHNLADSEYSTRKKQCEKAAEVLGRKSLRDVTLTEIKEMKNQLEEVIYRRALHVITEIERTIEAAKALREEDYVLFGKLMQESHKSLKENYEVSCPELDTVVNAALEVEGVFGARMTGGGFGGCTVTLLKTSAIDKTVHNIKEKYDRNPSFYICRPGDGAQLIKLPV